MRWDASLEALRRRRTPSGSGDHAFAHSVEDQLGKTVQVELLLKIPPVRFHCVEAQPEKIRNVLVGVSLGEQMENLTLADRQ